MLKFHLIFIALLLPLLAWGQTEKVSAIVTATMQNGDPSTIRIADYLGGKTDDCIRQRVKRQDVHHLVAPFYKKDETRWWQSEFWGKWMLGAVLSYQYTKDPVLLDSIQTAVKGLLGSQLPNGYIGNYSNEAQLQQWDIWGRKYSMLGLLAYYDLTGDNKALNACRGIADHLMTQVGPGKTNIVSTGNYIGMASSSILEPMMLLYRRTADQRYLDFSRYIVAQWETDSGPQLISKAGIPVSERFPHPKAIGVSWFGAKNGQKAYEMMSCYEGLLELYKVTNDPRYLSAVEQTVHSIIGSEINIAGSGSAFECWYHGQTLQTQPTYHTMETCVTTTWMKLCQSLLLLTGNPAYADQIEKSAYNALLASMKDDASQIAKYSPLEGQRVAGEEQCGMHINCCNANGPRGFALLPQFALMRSSSAGIVVNLYTGFTAKVTTASKKQAIIRQESNYPADGHIQLSIDTDKPEAFTLSLRIPEWSKNNSVSINGIKMDGVMPGTYCKIDRTWKKGDMVLLELDVRGRIVRQNGHAAIIKGPVVLARDSRFNDGFIDETAQISTDGSYIGLSPVGAPKGIWMAYTAPLILGTDLEGEGKQPKQIRFCDFASAGNTWQYDARYKVWLTETLNVRNEPYESYQ